MIQIDQSKAVELSDEQTIERLKSEVVGKLIKSVEWDEEHFIITFEPGDKGFIIKVEPGTDWGFGGCTFQDLPEEKK